MAGILGVTNETPWRSMQMVMETAAEENIREENG